MCRFYFKTLFLLTLLAFGCKKEERSDRDFNELNFDETGKFITFEPYGLEGDPQTYSFLTIPEGAIEGPSQIEFYRFSADTSVFKDIYVHWWSGYVQLLFCSEISLRKNATLKFPMPFSNYTPTSLYKPYKVKMTREKNLITEINNPANRIPVTDYAWDNEGKFFIIYTNDLNAAYFMARPKK
jgi:hypothetical protein